MQKKVEESSKQQNCIISNENFQATVFYDKQVFQFRKVMICNFQLSF